MFIYIFVRPDVNEGFDFVGSPRLAAVISSHVLITNGKGAYHICSPGHVSPAVCIGAVNTGPYRGLLKYAHFPDPIEAAQMRSLAQIPTNSAFQMVRTRVRVHTGGTALKPGIWCGVKRSETTFPTGLGTLHLVRTRVRLTRSHQRKRTELRAFGSNGAFSPHQLMSV